MATTRRRMPEEEKVKLLEMSLFKRRSPQFSGVIYLRSHAIEIRRKAMRADVPWRTSGRTSGIMLETWSVQKVGKHGGLYDQRFFCERLGKGILAARVAAAKRIFFYIANAVTAMTVEAFADLGCASSSLET
ncbi:hypothetical protein NE237_024436 [Protea cynaroides]|uniref:Uncharacterized protein n=1 Tax=Protea cynaroides TaxID=273540 RepID=A0A9Q0HI01_9MAGN|nr:hypothetical protein NE237_024436 [Protea cynaroides]